MAQIEKRTLTLPPKPFLKKAKLAFQKELRLDSKGTTVLVSQSSLTDVKKLLKDHLFSWQLDLLKDGSSRSLHFQTEKGHWMLFYWKRVLKRVKKSSWFASRISLHKGEGCCWKLLTKRDQKRKSVTIHLKTWKRKLLEALWLVLKWELTITLIILLFPT